MIRQTSREAFIEILPRIGERQEQVLEHLNWVGEATDRMIAASLKLPINCITGRRNEIMKAGLVTEAKRGFCEAVRMEEGKKRTSIYWKITKKGEKVLAFKKRQKESNDGI